MSNENDTLLSRDKSVSRTGNLVLRPAHPWTASVHALLRHLEQAGFPAPRVVGSGFQPDGREALSYVEGEFVHPYAWRDEAIVEVGRLLRRLHDATASFVPPADAVWQPWFLRELGGPHRVIGHGDVAPWNMVTRAGMPVALIDWEYAGPVDPMFELARTCLLFPQLVDDDIAEKWRLPPATVRARQVRLLADAYGLSAAQRHDLLEHILEVGIREAAQEAIDAGVTPESVGPLWGIAWRTRSAAWITRHRSTLAQALA
ncbi:MAG: phosphotransferase [Mycobacterium leprae]